MGSVKRTTKPYPTRDDRVAAIRTACETASVPFELVFFRDIDAQSVTIPAGLFVALLLSKTTAYLSGSDTTD